MALPRLLATRSSLTVLVATIDGEEKLARILPHLREIADELVVAVDDSTTDASGDIAHQYADVVCSIPHASFFPRGKQDFIGALDIALGSCHADWILRVDHDETLGDTWSVPGRLQELLSDRYATHYNILRRWATPPGERFIASYPWYTDYQTRLFRNLPAIIRSPREVHRDIQVLGEARYLTHEWLVHWDLVWHPRETREAKARACGDLGPSSGAESGVGDADFNEWYLYEGKQYHTRPLDYVPPRAATGTVESVNLTSEPLSCRIQALEVPDCMPAGRAEPLVVSITNTSRRLFRPGIRGSEPANVHLSYHWRDTSGAIVPPWDRGRTEVPARLEPGGTTVLFLPVREFPPPGSYLLQLDLVEEHVAWASSRGVEVPSYPIEVVSGRTGE